MDAGPKCEGVVLSQNTDPAPCHLRSKIKLDACQPSPGVYDTWLKPQKTTTTTSTTTTTTTPTTSSMMDGSRQSAGDAAHETPSVLNWGYFPERNCFMHSASDAVSGQDRFEGATLDNCKAACVLNEQCEAFLISKDTCWLRKHVSVSFCNDDNGYDLWRLDRESDTNAQILSLIFADSWPGDSRHSREQQEHQHRGAGGSEHQSASPWTLYRGRNCYPGRGAQPSFQHGHDELRRVSLESCKRHCEDTMTCSGIISFDTGDRQVSCWFRTQVEPSRCMQDPRYDLWLLNS